MSNLQSHTVYSRNIQGRLENEKEFNPSLVQNTGNVSRENCISSEQSSANARVCLYDLQVSREIFPEPPGIFG